VLLSVGAVGLGLDVFLGVLACFFGAPRGVFFPVPRLANHQVVRWLFDVVYLGFANKKSRHQKSNRKGWIFGVWTTTVRLRTKQTKHNARRDSVIADQSLCSGVVKMYGCWGRAS